MPLTVNLHKVPPLWSQGTGGTKRAGALGGLATRWRWCSTSSPSGAGLQRRPGHLPTTSRLTDKLLPESSSSREMATPSFQFPRPLTSETILGSFILMRSSSTSPRPDVSAKPNSTFHVLSLHHCLQPRPLPAILCVQSQGSRSSRRLNPSLDLHSHSCL